MLRRLRAGDILEFCRVVAISREDVEPWHPLHNPGESDAALFRRMLDLAAEGDARGSAWRRVAVLPGGRIAGFFNLNGISRGMTWEADATWWLSSDRVGLGLARRGLLATLAHAFSPLPRGLGLSAVHAGIDPANTRCVRTAEACGFVHAPGRRSHLRLGQRWVAHEFYAASAPPVLAA